MRLKSLKMAGFKSFANPTTFTFRHGITAIVGPNGCGKSNVIDAIRWVLGESSAKQLRGGAMSDVIFAGTESKAAKSVASVELTFEHTQDEQTGIRHELNLYHELSIRRQINLEGKSDYFINGTRCRRRDVIDVFLGTGLGSRSYAVIQQGMIGRIVDSSPMQLREFIEEAAGVSRYQARREETQKKLETTQDNLLRLEDVRSELARQKKALVKQAESADAYQALKDELSDVQQKLAIAQLTEAKLQELEHKAEQQRLNQLVEAALAQLTSHKSKLSQLESRMTEAQWLKDDAQDRYHQYELSRQQAQHQLSALQDKISQSERRVQGLQAQIERSDSELAEFTLQQQQQTQRLNELTPQFEALTQQLAAQQASQQPLQQQWQALQTEINATQTQLRRLEQQQALHAQAQRQLDTQRQKWQAQQQQWQQQVEALAATTVNNKLASEANPANAQLSLAEQIQQHQSSIASAARQQEDIEEELAVAQPKLNQLSQALALHRQTQQTLEKRHASLLGEYDSLQRMLQPPQPKHQPKQEHDHQLAADAAALSPDSQQQLLVSLAQLPTLSEQIELSEQGRAFSEVLDYWLGFWLDALLLAPDSQETVAASKDTAGNDTAGNDTAGNGTAQLAAALQALFTTQQAEAASQQTEEKVAANTLLFAADPAAAAAPTIENALPLSQLLRQPQLAIWQRCYLYIGGDDLPEGALPDSTMLNSTLAALPKGAVLLTANGWMLSEVAAVHLSKLMGQRESAHNSQLLTQRLQQQQRLVELEEALSAVEEELDALTQVIKKAQASHDELAVSVQELAAQSKAITHSKHEQQQRLTGLQAQHERQKAEQARLDTERERLTQEQQELTQAEQELAGQMATTAEQLSIVQPQLEQQQQRQTQLDQLRQSQQQALQKDNETLQEIRFDIKEAELAAKHADEQCSKIRAQQAQLHNSLLSVERTLLQDQQKLPKIQQDKKEADTAAHEQLVALEEYKASLTGLKQEHATAQQGLEQLQGQLQAQQLQLAEIATQVAVLAERIKEASERLVATGASVSASTILTEVITHGRRGGNKDKHQVNQQQLHQREVVLTEKLAKMGPVNLAAAAELKEIDARLLPLEQQIEDISASMDTLTDAIATIDSKTKTLFMQTLEAVNDDLDRLFAKVFGGGRAQLSLQEDDGLSRADKWRAGLELMAQPKGKKNSRLAVLSGGEKTLTALSLIFAIFKQHPAPFCVLDEVDAPLDDANVARFTSLIHELADDVQFIFISHNKLAMQIADELKGITMPQPGVSTLVSVSLEEAEKYIEA